MATLLYFGRLSDTTGCSSEQIELPSQITDSITLRNWVDKRFGLQGALLEPTIKLAINNAFAIEPAVVSNTDEIAFMPPVGGG